MVGGGVGQVVSGREWRTQGARVARHVRRGHAEGGRRYWDVALVGWRWRQDEGHGVRRLEAGVEVLLLLLVGVGVVEVVWGEVGVGAVVLVELGSQLF